MKQRFFWISACVLITQGLSVGIALAQRDNYGAIAISKSGASGYSHDYPTREQAEQRALKECGQPDCQIQVWFKNACGAVAQDPQGNLGWGWAANREQAEATALSECATGTCKVQVWACTTR